MNEIFGPDGNLAAVLPAFEARSGQLEMAQAIDDLLNGKSGNVDGVLLAEAETGIGKTLAYLVPAILSKQRVVVSTATINLQDQILNKEIPLIEKVFNTVVPVVCVKGRQNYLCHYRFYQYRSSQQISMFDDGNCERIEEWLHRTETGDRSELPWLEDRSSLWPKISAQSHQCLGAECPEAELCFVNALRRRAGAARLLVVNHHLFFSDLSLKQNGFGEILPRYESVIFDEAHHLESIATTFFGKSFSQYQFLDLLSDIERQADEDLTGKEADKLINQARGIKTRIERFMSMFPERLGRFPLMPIIKGSKQWRIEIEELSLGLKNLTETIDLYHKRGESWRLFTGRAKELRENLLEIGLPEEGSESEHYVYWYERRKRSVLLSASPINIADELQQFLYSQTKTCVMTSATLTTGGGFSYIKQRLGLNEDTAVLQLESPFDYEKHALLYGVEQNFPAANEKGYDEKLAERMYDILQNSKGRALLLFTSFKAMDMVAEYLEDKLSYPLLVQGTMSRRALLEEFKENVSSVLLAVASFWEGVDVSGESLSLVVIDKLPFEVPSDPVIKARMEAISKAGGKPFFDFQIPRAILTLRQGVGRLMRSSTDSGVIAIMDVRLFSKGYGRIFIKSLPSAPITRELKDVEKFFSHE